MGGEISGKNLCMSEPCRVRNMKSVPREENAKLPLPGTKPSPEAGDDL